MSSRENFTTLTSLRLDGSTNSLDALKAGSLLRPNSTVTGSLRHVEDLNDLPPALENVIYLFPNVTYYFANDIDLQGARLVSGRNTVILGSSSENSKITSTGLSESVALLSSRYTTPVRHVTFRDVHTCLNFEGSSDSVALDWTGVNFQNIPNVGVVNRCSNFIFSKGAFLNSKGLVFTGSIGTVGVDNTLFVSDGLSGSILEIPTGTTITRRFRIIYSSMENFGDTVALNIHPSASIPAESYILDTINFSGGGAYLEGLRETNNKSLFINCVGITNTTNKTHYYLLDNVATTTVGSTYTPYKAIGETTGSVETSRFTHTSNRATYIGAFSSFFVVHAILSVQSGNNQQVACYVFKNGISVAESRSTGTATGNGKVENMTVQSPVFLTTGDYIEIYVENRTNATDILVTSLNVIVS
jgi:hypothetical protein